MTVVFTSATPRGVATLLADWYVGLGVGLGVAETEKSGSGGLHLEQAVKPA